VLRDDELKDILDEDRLRVDEENRDDEDDEIDDDEN
jgi:hypothetical protein